MQAYEFYAKPEDGVIPIPDKYKNQITSSVKVIVLEHISDAFSGEKSNAIRKSDLLLAPTLDTRGFKFDREDANER